MSSVLGWKIRRESRPRVSCEPVTHVEEIWAALDDVLDPELGVPVTDLGLVYDVRLSGSKVGITMTTTTPVCPLGSFLKQQVARRLPGNEVQVEIVHEPLWTPEMMNERARRQLGWS